MNMFRNFEFKKNIGLNDEDIFRLEKKNNWVIPEYYKNILKFSDGLELDQSITLFGKNDLEEANYEIYDTSYFSKLLIIGCTGGGDVLAVEQKFDSKVLFIYDSGSLFPGDENMTIKNIEKWFLNKCPIEQEMFGKVY